MHFKFLEIIPVRNSKKHADLIQNSITNLGRELDRYIEIMKEVPWWYNEKSLLGFYMGGLIRNTDAVILQEISCSKGKKGDKKGRADLWFKYLSEEYITEAKLCYTSINTDPDFEDASKWARAVLAQANKYRKDLEIKKDNVFSLCFEVIYCKRNNLKNILEKIKNNWINESNDKGILKLNFYYLIHLNQNTLDRLQYFEYKDEYYPAVAVYGLFNK